MRLEVRSVWCRVIAGFVALLSASVWAQPVAPPQLLAAVHSHAEKAGVRLVVRWRHALADLNGDGVQDALVLLLDPDWCGTGGCTMLVLRGGKRGFAVLSSSSVTDAPIRVSPLKAGGWKSLIVYSRGRGDVLMRFDGARYPNNPSLLPKATAAQVRAAAVVIE
jgi:hypothetical protein